MTYSPRAWWIAKTSSLGIALVFVLLLRWLHPGKSVAVVFLAFVVLVVMASLGMRAFFYRDEIQRQERMTCWYFGSQVGTVVAGIAALAIFAFFAVPFRDAMINFFSTLNPAFVHQRVPYFRAGFACGLALVVFVQAAGALLVRAYRALPKRSES